MRTYLYLFLSLLLFSCQIDPEDENTRIEKIAAFDIQMPDNMNVNFEYTISFSYALPNGCYSFFGFDIESDDITEKNVRLIYAFAEVANDEICSLEYSEEVYSFRFTPDESKTYLFRFWIGQNDEGIDQYEEIELIVV